MMMPPFRFVDRADAGRRLADAVRRAVPDLKQRRALLLGIPRGGVAVAAAMAERLALPLDVLVVRKIGAPGQPELAVGAVGPDGKAVYQPAVLEALGLRPDDLRAEEARAREEVHRRLAAYGAGPPDTTDLAIVVDDGIATGATVLAALAWLKAARPELRLLVAAPVAPPEARKRLASLADRIVLLAEPEPFYAVGQFYRHFPQLEDDAVLTLLDRHRRR
ncbi:phosphoribosyltransferase [Hydrogenibacillus schlegelii]|nr:phosphoribosyltransferase family protein [Hydrogenibacillus schlegelii]